VECSEQLQAHLLAFVQPIARSTLATLAGPASRVPAAPPTLAPLPAAAGSQITARHDPLRPPNTTTAYVHMHDADSNVTHDATSLLDTVDEIMKVSEGALLTTRMLLRHMAEVVAYVYGVEVPVHPSMHHKLGRRTIPLTEVCATRIDYSRS
jgi:hypothetical protein